MKRTGTLINKTYRNLLVSTLAMTASMYLSSIVDGILVGQILGTMELSAINLTYSISFLKNILIAMFTFGGNTLAIMYKGKRDNKKADIVFSISFWAGRSGRRCSGISCSSKRQKAPRRFSYSAKAAM